MMSGCFRRFRIIYKGLFVPWNCPSNSWLPNWHLFKLVEWTAVIARPAIPCYQQAPSCLPECAPQIQKLSTSDPAQLLFHQAGLLFCAMVQSAASYSFKQLSQCAAVSDVELPHIPDAGGSAGSASGPGRIDMQSRWQTHFDMFSSPTEVVQYGRW